MDSQKINQKNLEDLISGIAYQHRDDNDPTTVIENGKFSSESIKELEQELWESYLTKKEAGKFEGKGEDYIAKALHNRANDHWRKKKKYTDVIRSLESAVKYSTDQQFLDILSDDYENFDQIKDSKDIQLIPAGIPFQQLKYYMGPYLAKPNFPENYKDKIWLSDRVSSERIRNFKWPENYDTSKNNEKLDLEGIRELERTIGLNANYKSIKMYEEMGVCKPLTVKNLFWHYLEKFSKQAHTDWNIANRFTYYGAMKEFCNIYKYNNWSNLKTYSSEYRKKTNIQAEYYYIDEIIRVIDLLYERDEKGTLTNICKELGVKNTNSKVMFYLSYQILAQNIKYEYDKELKAGIYIPYSL